MKKEEVVMLSHLFSAMKDAVKKLEESMASKDNEGIVMAKKELLSLQKQVDSLL